MEEEDDIPGLDADMGKAERVECGEARKSHALLLVGAAQGNDVSEKKNENFESWQSQPYLLLLLLMLLFLRWSTPK